MNEIVWILINWTTLPLLVILIALGIKHSRLNDSQKSVAALMIVGVCVVCWICNTNLSSFGIGG